MPKLNDTQTILLSSASCREDSSVYPLPEALADAGVRVTKAVATLINLGLIEEREVRDQAAVHRADGDVRYGVFLTDAGKAAVGVDDAVTGAQTPAPPVAAPNRTSKSAAVVALLQRDTGATLAELIAATDWLPHTTRAALTGLRRKGHAIERTKRDTATCYRIAAAAR